MIKNYIWSKLNQISKSHYIDQFNLKKHGFNILYNIHKFEILSK